MTSNGTQRAHEESASASADVHVDVDPGRTERKPEPLPAVQGVSAEAAPVSEASEAPTREAAPVAEATKPAPEPEAAPVASATKAAPPPAEATAGSDAPKAPASVPPARLESSAPLSSLAPAVEISDEFVPRSTFWSTRPNRPWMVVGGSAIVIAFLVGAMTERLVQPDRSPEFVAQPLHASEAPANPPVTAAPVEPAASAPETRAQGVAVAAPAKRLPAFNAKAAKAAIDGVAPRLKACKHAGDPKGPASVMVTFAPAGSVSSAAVTTTGYAGTRTGNCIVQRLRELRVPEFTGSAVTVKRSVTVR